MRRPPLAITLVATALMLVAGCSDDGDQAESPAGLATTATSVSTTSVGTTSKAPPTSTTAAPTTTARPVDPCAEPPGPITGGTLATPDDANRECDAAAGWRLFFWIGESGDPIYRVQRLVDRAWVDEGYDVACGLDAEVLQTLGMPAQLAAVWGDKYDGQC